MMTYVALVNWTEQGIKEFRDTTEGIVWGWGVDGADEGGEERGS